MPRAYLNIAFCIFLLAGVVAPAGAQNIAAGQRKYGLCATCHGIEGRSFKRLYPILAGQNGPYLFLQLNDFKQHRRSDPSMDAIVPQLSTQDMLDLAGYFASLRPSPRRFKPDPSKAARGMAKEAKLACTGCHPRNDSLLTRKASRIVGQHHDYLVKQLRDFRDGRRTNDGGIMRDITQSLTDADIDDLGNYFAGLQ